MIFRIPQGLDFRITTLLRGQLNALSLLCKNGCERETKKEPL